MLQLARWLTFIEQFDYEIEHWPGTKHGNADGLSRKVTPAVRMVKTEEHTMPTSAGESMAERQLKDAEIGTFVSLRLTQEQPPEKAEIQ